MTGEELGFFGCLMVIVVLAAGLVVGSLSFVLSRALFKALPRAGECRVHF